MTLASTSICSAVPVFLSYAPTCSSLKPLAIFWCLCFRPFCYKGCKSRVGRQEVWAMFSTLYHRIVPRSLLFQRKSSLSSAGWRWSNLGMNYVFGKFCCHILSTILSDYQSDMWFFFFQIYVIWLNAVKIEGLTLMKVGCFMWNKQCTVPSPFPLGKKKNQLFYLPFI